MRLDRWFKAHYPEIPHSRLEKFLRKGEVRVDGGRAKSNRRVAQGEIIRIPPLPESSSAKPAAAAPEDAAFINDLVLYQDDAIIALNKPSGLAVQGGSRTRRHIDAMAGALAKDGVAPRLVHRLDKDTAGLLILARTRRAAQLLGAAFKSHKIEKIYWAVTVGCPNPRQGRIDLPLTKASGISGHEKMVPDPGKGAKAAVTDFQLIEEAGPAAFVALRPVTGRTHQLRAHMAAIACPILGDRKYGGEAAIIEGTQSKLHLFCRSMTFVNPSSGRKMTLSAPLTGHMRETWEFFEFDDDAQCDWPEQIVK